MIFEARLGREIVGGFYDAYKALGFGLPERMCLNALSLELQRRGLAVQREVGVEVSHLGSPIGSFRLDLVVEDRVIVEVKSVKTLGDADVRQILTYLKTSKFEVGILLNFGPRPEHRRFVFTADRRPNSSIRARSDSFHS